MTQLSLSRRNFLAASAAGLAIRPWSRVLGANSDIRVAVIGVRNIGKTHLMNFPKIPGVRVVAVCDVDSDVLGQRADEFEKQFGAIRKYTDLREVMDAPDVDAVVLAVPNHWHALGTIWACQAGKDVYVEKPCSYNIWEAGQMIQAAEKYQRIVQVGIQRRSLAHMQDWFREVQAGALGKIRSVHGMYYARRQPIGRVDAPIAPPPQVNHDLWSGPAPTPIWRKNYHYDWHWFWDVGNGELGNNGPHILDLARTALGVKELPTKVWSLGGRYGWEDDNGQTPNTHIIHYGYEPAPIIMEIRNLPARAGTKENNLFHGINLGIVIEGEEGRYVGFDTGKVFDRDGKLVREITGKRGADGGRQPHRENFIKAMRSRNSSDLNCNLQDGHLSSSLCHLGNISHLLGKEVSLPEAEEQIKSAYGFGEAGERLKEHLQLNDLPTNELAIQLGAPLKYDPKQVTFPESPAATALLKREYRAPFIVPETV
jgi:Predicted dehydrogenases and related proteins